MDFSTKTVPEMHALITEIVHQLQDIHAKFDDLSHVQKFAARSKFRGLVGTLYDANLFLFQGLKPVHMWTEMNEVSEAFVSKQASYFSKK